MVRNTPTMAHGTKPYNSRTGAGYGIGFVAFPATRPRHTLNTEFIIISPPLIPSSPPQPKDSKQAINQSIKQASKQTGKTAVSTTLHLHLLPSLRPPRIPSKHPPPPLFTAQIVISSSNQPLPPAACSNQPFSATVPTSPLKTCA